MQIVHESGHVLAGLLTGGKIATVLLHPLDLSRTELSFNPHPLPVAWGGPLFGCAAPLLLWLLSRKLSLRSLPLIQWFTGFTLIANGVYIGTGAFSPIGDAEDMITNGCSRWLLFIFGAIAVPAGFMLWNGLGRRLGIGAESEIPSTRTTAVLVIVLVLTIGAELVFATALKG